MTGYRNAADIERCLSAQGVRLIIGKKGRPVTTVDALNQALGVRLATEEPVERIEF